MANPTLVELFQDIADEIRNKRKDLETTDLLVAANFPEEIRKIVTDPSGDVTATASDILYGKTACISGDGSITTGTMPDKTGWSSSLSYATQSITIPKGYHDGTKTVTASYPSSSISGGDLTLKIASSTTNPYTTAPSWNSTSSKWEYSVSAGRAAVSNASAGWTTKSTVIDTDSTSNTIQIPKIGISVVGGTETLTPNFTVGTLGSNETWINAANGTTYATSTTASTPYVKLAVSADAKPISITPSVTIAGYGGKNSGEYTISTNTSGTAKLQPSTIYVPIKTTSPSSNKITTQGGTVTISPGYITSSQTITATFPTSTAKVTADSFTITPSITYDSSTGKISATGSNDKSITPTVSQNGYITTTSVTSGKISASLSGGSVTPASILPASSVPSSLTITAQNGTLTIGAGWLASSQTITATITSGSVSATSALTFAGKTSNTTITPNWTANSDVSAYISSLSATISKTSLKAGYFKAQDIVSEKTITHTLSIPAANIKVSGASISITPTIASNTSSISGCTNAAASATLVSSVTSGNVYVPVTVSGSNTGNASYSATAGYLPDTDATNISSKASINSTTKYIQIKTATVGTKTLNSSTPSTTITAGYLTSDTTITASYPAGSATSGVGTIKVTSSTSLTQNSSNAYIFRTVLGGSVAAATVGTGWVTAGSGKGNSITSYNLDLPVIKLDATASGSSTITPTFKQASKGSSESWYDAINSSSSIVETAPTTAAPYVRVTMTGGSSTVKATPSVNTAGYGSTVTNGSVIVTEGTKTVTVGNKDLYIPIKVGSITVGSPTITLTASNSAFTLSKGNIKFTPNSAATGTANISSFTRGWIESQPSSGKITVSGTVSKDLTVSDLTTLAGTATLGVSTSGGTLNPVLYTTTSAFTTGTNAASGAVETSPASGGVYAKVSIDATTISNSATPKITGAGYIGITNGTTSTFNSTVNAKAVYVPIATTTVTNSCTITGTSVALNTSISKNSSNGISVPVKATGNGSVTIKLNRTGGGWVSSVTGGSASATITGTLNLTTSQLQGIESGLKSGNILSGVSIFGVSGSIKTVDLQTTENTFTQVNNFSVSAPVSSTSTTGAITISNGGLVAASGIKGSKVYNAVWNDLADLIPVDEECELEFGKCYCFDGEKYYKSTKYLDDGIIGIHSDVAGFEMGHKKDAKELKCSVAGFVLSYVDKEYPVGTLLTCTQDGYLTEIKKEDKINYPEKIVGSYWKDEKEEYWGSEQHKVLVNGRKWIKVR